MRAGSFDEIWRLCPYPEARSNTCAGTALNQAVDWASAEAEYLRTGVMVIDDFLSPEVLEELWAYTLEGPTFRTVRNGFLGAFPGDGFGHPLVAALARELEARWPRVLGAHPLGLYWIFKYTDAGPRGIGIHADAAAVNVNIWLTPDVGRRSGGGLDIFTSVPPTEASVQDFNEEFKTREDEAAFRRKLEADGEVIQVDYRRNRAAIFVSDLFHVSQPFDFPDADNLPRANLTLLFGDRAAREHRSARSAGSSSTAALAAQSAGSAAAGGGGTAPAPATAEAGGDDGWDLFE